MRGECRHAFLSPTSPGLQRYTPELISLYAPNVNSYRRLAPEISAPINLNWGLDNRTVAFRVPNGEKIATRVENRFPGADANPYLAIAATLASGLSVCARNVRPTEPHRARRTRTTWRCADPGGGAAPPARPPAVCELFGDLFLRAYAAVKLDEFEEFNRVISSWEREHLLLQV
jgi:glutamine synthetase